MKALFYGVAVAAVAGLSLGAIAQPSLSLRYRSAPHTAVAPPAQPVQYGADFASRSGAVPDYVIGTDWVSSPVGEGVATVADPYAYAEAEPEPTPVDYAHAPAPIEREPFDAMQPPPPVMPSMGGGVAPEPYQGEAPPAPPEQASQPIEDPWLG